jgi:hypothetical protein
MAFLLVITIAFNILNFNTIEAISETITFIGIALGYFLFNKINLNQQIHLPLFLYTFFVFALYHGNLDIGISVTLLSNSFLLLILTNTDDKVKKSSYVIIGSLLALNYFFLPTTWPMLAFDQPNSAQYFSYITWYCFGCFILSSHFIQYWK